MAASSQDMNGSQQSLVSPLISKLPKVALTGDHLNDTKLRNNRKSMEKLLNILHTKPHLTMDTCSYAEDLSTAEDHKALGGGVGATNEATGTFAGAGDEFWQEWLADHTSLNKKALSQVFAHDAQGILQIIEYVLKALRTAKVGDKAAHNRVVLDKAAVIRMDDVEGYRLDRLKDILQDDGKLDWSKGVYEIEFELSKGAAVIHTPSGHRASLEDFRIDDTMFLEHNQSDLSATISDGNRTKYKLCTAFKQKRGAVLKRGDAARRSERVRPMREQGHRRHQKDPGNDGRTSDVIGPPTDDADGGAKAEGAGSLGEEAG